MTPAGRPPRTDKRKSLTLYMDEALHREVKVLAAQQGTTMTELVEQALRRYLGEGKGRELYT